MAKTPAPTQTKAPGPKAQTPTPEPKTTGVVEAPRPGVEELLDAVFLTPRVVDQRAIEDFGGVLRGLIRDASAQERALQTAGAEVRILGEQLRQASQELGLRVEGAVRAVAAIDDRLTRAEQLLRSAAQTPATPSAPAPTADDLDTRIRRIAAELLAGTPAANRPGESAHHVSAAESALEARADEAVIRVAALGAQVEAGMAKATAVRESLEHTLRDAEGRLAAVVDWADRVPAIAQEASASALAQATAGLESRITQLVEDASTRAAAACAQPAEAARTAAKDAETARLQAELARQALGIDLLRGTESLERLTQAYTQASAELQAAQSRASAAAEASTSATKSLETTLGTARELGDGLARLVAHADTIGRGLDALIRRARGT